MRPLVLIGYDAREALPYQVCRASILAHGGGVDVLPLRRPVLEASSLYRRGSFIDAGQSYDVLDGKPFSTEFSFTRFLAPVVASLMDREWVLFVDSDFLFRRSVYELFEVADPTYAVQVVKHDYRPEPGRKLRGQVKQERYNRKLWSALMLMQVQRCRLTPFQVNTMPGAWLHGFQWLDDAAIGPLPESWHWVVGHSALGIEPAAVHYTLGTPDVPGHEHDPFAAEWWEFAREETDGDPG